MCYRYKGILIPECIGVAAAMGCGKNHDLIKAYCTCSHPDSELEKRLEALEKEINKLKLKVKILWYH